MGTLTIEDNVAIAFWDGEDGTGDAVQMENWPDKTIQATGTGTVTLEGSPDGTNFVALKDQSGTAISLAAASNQASVVLENTRYVRPVVAAGTADVTIVGSRGS